MKKTANKYFKVVTDEGADSADILLYGVIGQDFWWGDDDLKEETITDLEFTKTLRRLEATYNRINIRINSPGGSMYHGNAIISAIRSSKAEVHTYNDGLAASMAADIWLSVNNRHMASNGLLMIHSPSTYWTSGTAKDLRNEAEVLDKFEHTIIAVMASTTDMTAEQIKAEFYDYEDHWLTAEDCREKGFISVIEDYEVEGLPDDIQNMTVRDLFKHFKEQDSSDSGNWLKGLRRRALEVILPSAIQKANQFPNINNREMTITEIKKALGDDTIVMNDLADILRENGYEVTEPAPETDPDSPDIEAMVATAVANAVKPLEDKIAEQADTIKLLGDQPGDQPTKVASEGDDNGDKEPDDLDDFNKSIANAARTSGRI